MPLFKIEIQTKKRNEFINIAHKVSELLNQSCIKEGLAVIYTPHTTAGITINENADPDVVSDMLNALTKIFPENDGYRHIEGNSDSHLKSSFTGASQTVIIGEGKLLLGQWQGIYFCEFDGPRNRQVYVKFING